MEQAILDNNNIAISAGSIRVFNYDAISGEYRDTCEEFLPAGVGLPANTCIDAPPKNKKGYSAVRVGEGWQMVVDHRGKTLYSTETGQVITINELGALPANSTALAPSTAFDQWNGKQWVTDQAAQQEANKLTALQQRAELIISANAAITPLTDAVDLAIATVAEIALLNEWRRYRVLLNRIEIEKAPDIIWPELPA